MRDGLKLMEDILYLNKENEKAFPKGSIIAGFKRQRNIGEIIAPTLPLRAAREQEERGCFPCEAPRSCILHEAGSLQQTSQVISSYNGQTHKIPRKYFFKILLNQSVFELEKCNLAKNWSEFCQNLIGNGFRTARAAK